MTPWLFLDDGVYPADKNMARDEELFGRVMSGEAGGAVRFYNWDSPAVTAGYHQKDFRFADDSVNIPIFKRPTGGGAVLHFDDITFSICSRAEGLFHGDINGVYRTISVIFLEAFAACGIDARIHSSVSSFSDVCFERTAQLELTFEGKKIMGAAQVRKKDFFLLQGVIPLRVDEGLYSRIFGPTVKLPRGIMQISPGFSVPAFISSIRVIMGKNAEIAFENHCSGLKKLCRNV
jgi:lipoate-protein ligase A